MTNTVATATEFPVGHVFDIEFPDFTPRITIGSEKELTFMVEGMMQETVQYQVVNLRPGLFLVTWQEQSRATVVHVEDFAEGIVYTNITMQDNTFIRMSGKIKAVQA